MKYVRTQPQSHTDLLAKRPPLKTLSRLSNNVPTLTIPKHTQSYSTLCQAFQNTSSTLDRMPTLKPDSSTFALQAHQSGHSKQKKRLKSINQSLVAKHPLIQNCPKRNHSTQEVYGCKLGQQQYPNNLSQNKKPCGKIGVVSFQSLLSTTQIQYLTAYQNNALETYPWSEKLFESMSYKITESHVVLASRQNIRIDESVMEERSILQDFVLVKKIVEDEYMSIEKKTGLCLVVKIVPLHAALPSPAIINDVTPQHPNILKYYRTMEDDHSNSLTLKEFFEEYLCQSISRHPPCQISSFIMQIFLLFCDLLNMGLSFQHQVFENVVLTSGVCKINNLSCVVDSNPEAKLFSLLTNFIDRLASTSNNPEYKSVLESLAEHISKCNYFSQIKGHPVFQY